MHYGSVVRGSRSMDCGSVIRGVRSMDFRCPEGLIHTCPLCGFKLGLEFTSSNVESNSASSNGGGMYISDSTGDVQGVVCRAIQYYTEEWKPG